MIGIITCMWKRPYVFEIFAEGIKRLKTEFNIVTVSVGSEGTASHNLCDKYGIKYVEFNNKPLGAKFNAGMLELKQYDPECVVVMGSDDLISNKTLGKLKAYMDKGYDMAGFTDVWFYDLIKKHLHYWSGYGHRPDKKDSYRRGEAIGMGRTLSGSLLDKLKWTPWKDNVDRGLDWWMSQKIKQFKVKTGVFELKSNRLFGVDLKSKNNICNHVLYKTSLDFEDMTNHISEKEIIMIKNKNIELFS